MTEKQKTGEEKKLYSKGLESSEKDEFQPLSHWFRREILNQLKNKDLTFTELLNSINQKQSEKIGKSRLHQHLEILVNGRYLRRYRERANTWYVLNPDKFQEVSNYLKSFF